MKDVRLSVQTDDRDSKGRTGLEIKRPCRLSCQDTLKSRLEIGVSAVRQVNHRYLSTGGRSNHLDRGVIDDAEACTEHRVPRGDRRDAATQRVEVELASQPVARRDVVGARSFELLQIPQAFLTKRKRYCHATN